jgi:hypothetical protein
MNITEKIANVVEYSNLPQNLPRHTRFFFVTLWELLDSACLHTNGGAKRYTALPHRRE